MIEYFLLVTEFGAKAKRVYVATENLMSRQSYLILCHIKANPPSRQKVLGHGVFPCRDIVLYVVIVRHGAASQQGRALARQRSSVAQDREALLCTTMLGVHNRDSCMTERYARQRYSIATEKYLP